VERFFLSHICVDSEKAAEVGRSTQLQHCCETWHTEKKVSHRKETTSCHGFVKRKLVPKQLAVWYGKSNEELAIRT